MIIKSFELDKINLKKNNIFLLYGENEGFKNEIIKNYFYNKFSKNVYRYEEKEILNNKEIFFNNIMSKSFFDNKKLIIILRASEKILDIIETILEKNIEDIKIIINSGILDKKSKVRTFFEKNKYTICIPFYEDNNQTLSSIANIFFKEKKIPISQQVTNLIVERSRGDRQNLNNELGKIENYVVNKKRIDISEILKLTNLAENYDISELTDNCLAKNSKRIINILNENNFAIEDCILIIRTLLIKAKRILKIQTEINKNKKIEEIISTYKPPIFWKDKEIVKKQIKCWSLKNIENLIYEIAEIELLIKSNSINSINVLSDFIISQSKT
tara:strand:- start:1568 stop:2554 length:987 start_codon:yes stop_codon:yes gene_type:complete